MREANGLEDFKHILERRVKKAHFNNETMRKYNEFISNVDEAVKNADDLAKMSDDELALRGIFGENYAEFKGKGQEAINHLLETKSGQVQGAFHRDDLGDIDLVWGNDEIGLKKIINKHLNDFADFKGDTAQDKLANALSEIIAKGNLEKTHNGFNVNFNGYIVGLNRGWNENGVKIGDNKWIVTAFDNNKEISEKATATNFTRGAAQPQNLDEIIPNSNSQSQAPQKSLLEQARENTERLRAAQEAEQIAQKEAELARLKEMQAKNAEILAQKEAAAGQAINEAQSLEIGMPIKAHKISDTKIIINDNTAPFKAEFIIAKKDDIKPNFERTGTQGRSERQDKVIESIQSDFKPHLIFEQMGGFEGLPIILKDGQVIAGNHRAQAIKGLTGENLARYKQAAKEKFGVDLKDDEVIVRLVKDGDEKELINLAFMSNVGRESNLGEKALANLAKYDSQIQALPNRINADSVFELESQVAKALDTQGNGLNVFDTNLALFSRLAKNSSNTDILESLNTLKNLSQDEKEKVLRMFVSNAGEFHNLAKDTQLKSLNLNDYLADALIIAAKNVDSTTRAVNYAKLLDDIITMQASAKEMLKIDPFLFENFKSKALGYALARFARLENPSAKLFEFLKASKADLENLYTGNIFESNKAISDIDIYDFLKHAINSGEDLIDKQGRNIKGEITSRLDDLRKVENALIDSGEIQFAKSKAKPQGREAKETNINSLFADDELQMQATKPTRELNLSDEKDFNELGEFFALNSKDKEFNEIFAKATKAAQRLGVKVKFDESAARSHFILNDNTITIAAANKEHFQAQDLLHELIHATTRKALKDFSQSPEQAAKIYTKRQIEAIKEIISLYQKSKGIAKRQGKDAYALQNVDEFVAELSSSEFRAFLKAQDIFERFIKALIRFFTGDSEKLAKNVNSYKALKESYYKILDDYEPQVVPQKIADERAFDRTFAIQKTARYVDDYAKTSDFKALDSDKQEAILRLKEIEPSPMPKDLKAKIDNENIITHFSKHLDSEERKFYYKLFDDAKEKPDFVLLSKDGETIEYIKAYEHTAQKDMYYLAFTQSDDNIKITGIPTTQLRKVVKDIAQSKKVVKAEDLGGILELRQADKIQSPQLADEIIPNLKGQSQVKDLKSFELYINKQRELVDAEKSKYETLYEAYHKADDTLKEQIEKQGMDYREWYNAQKEGEFTPQKQKIVTMYENAMQQESKYKKALKNLQETAEHFRDIKILSEKVNSMSDKEYCKRLSSGDAFMTEDYFQQSFNKSRKFYETLTNSSPLKEFGTNYAEFYRDGQGAVKKLLAEKQGQVAGAFYRDDLAKATGTGEIDLVWGDSTKGLQHILERRAADFETQGLTKEQATQKALEFVENDLNNIITNGTLELPLDKNGVLVENPQKMFFHLDDKKSVIAVDYQGDRKWVLTAYFKGGDDTPRSAYPHKSEAHGDDFSTSSSAVSSNETLPQNELKSQADESQILSAYDKNVLENAPKETIEAHLKSIEKDIDYLEKGIDFYKKNPEQDYNGEMIKFNEKLLTPKLQMQKAYKQRLDELNSLDLSYAPKRNADEITTKIQEKFKFNEKKAKDLYEWRKDSSPLTKNDDGTPKVFYHGSTAKFETFIPNPKSYGIWLTSDKNKAIPHYEKSRNELYSVFAKGKKFYIGDEKDIEKIGFLKEPYTPEAEKMFEKLKRAGYDGIDMSDKNILIVFDSKQIKSIDNTGSWTDSAGKITKEKPSDESARHSYFNAQSPNILHSNEIWGGGLAGGTLNGLETDEDGNITSFDPAKFVAGFIAGAAGTKAVKLMLNSKAGQNHALKVATNISEDFKALRENNLPLFAKIMQKIEPQTLLKSSKEAKNLSNEIFNKELQNAIKTAIDKGGIENLSELKKQVHFSKVSEFKAYFDGVKGNQGVIKTPYKDIKVNVFYAFNHFTDNTYKTNRDNIKSAFFSTFKKPLFVVEFTPQGKTKPSTYFYKPFYDENKKLLNLVGISIDEKGLLKFSTFYLDERGNRLKEFLKRMDLTIRYVEPSE